MSELMQQSQEAQNLIKLLSEYVEASSTTADSLEKVCSVLEHGFDKNQLKELNHLVSQIHGEIIKLVAINDFFRDEIKKDRDLDAEREKREHELKLIQMKQRNTNFREIAAWILGGGGLITLIIKELLIK